MKPYLLSLGAGLLIGILYSLLDVRSPAPPLIALCGLLGILGGEQVIPIAKRIIRGDSAKVAVASICTESVLGRLPGDVSTTRKT